MKTQVVGHVAEAAVQAGGPEFTEGSGASGWHDRQAAPAGGLPGEGEEVEETEVEKEDQPDQTEPTDKSGCARRDEGGDGPKKRKRPATASRWRAVTISAGARRGWDRR